jgi:hypothetical protein
MDGPLTGVENNPGAHITQHLPAFLQASKFVFDPSFATFLPEAITMTKLESNRANAQLSTGPRSEAGKSRISRNATSHGLQSGDVVLAHENRADYLRILEHYQCHVDLSNPEEDFLATQIAQAQWRLGRAQRLTRLYLDLEITGPSAAPSPDEIIVRNMEQRGNDVPATLHRHETHFQRLWWRIIRKLQSLRERDAMQWEHRFERLMQHEEMVFAELSARSEAAIQAAQPEEEPETMITAEEEVELMTLQTCEMVGDFVESIESGQTNPTPALAAKWLSMDEEQRKQIYEGAKSKIAQTKPIARAA